MKIMINKVDLIHYLNDIIDHILFIDYTTLKYGSYFNNYASVRFNKLSNIPININPRVNIVCIPEYKLHYNVLFISIITLSSLLLNYIFGILTSEYIIVSIFIFFDYNCLSISPIY